MQEKYTGSADDADAAEGDSSAGEENDGNMADSEGSPPCSPRAGGRKWGGGGAHPEQDLPALQDQSDAPHQQLLA